MTRHLTYGETPYTILDRSDLEDVAHMTFMAMKALCRVVEMSRETERAMTGQVGPYWTQGVGGVALEMASQVFERLNWGIDPEQHVPETRDGSYWFRNAEDILFDTAKHPMLGIGWRVCEPCDMMLGSKHILPTEPCPRCGRPTRAIQRSDLLPVELRPKEPFVDQH